MNILEVHIAASALILRAMGCVVATLKTLAGAVTVLIARLSTAILVFGMPCAMKNKKEKNCTLKVYVLNHQQQQSMQTVAVEGLQVVYACNVYINIYTLPVCTVTGINQFIYIFLPSHMKMCTTKLYLLQCMSFFLL
jgi:hypothetical protein